MKCIQGVGACTFSIHSLDVLTLILSYFTSSVLCMLFVIFGLVKGGERSKGGGGGERPPFPL